MNRELPRRRGSLWTPFFLAIMIIGLVMALVVVYFIVQQMHGEFASSAFVPEIAVTLLKEGLDVLKKVQYGAVFLFSTVLIGAFVRAYKVQVPMILLFPSIVFIGIATWVVAKIANIGWRFINYGELQQAATELTLGVSIVENSVSLFLGAAIMLLVVLHLSGRLGIFGGGGGSA